MHTYIHVCTHVCAHTHMHTYIHVCTHAHTCVRTYTHGARTSSTAARLIRGAHQPAQHRRAHASRKRGQAPATFGKPRVTAWDGHAARAGKASRSRSDPPSTLRGRPAPEAPDLNLKTQRRGHRRQLDVQPGPASGLEPWPHGGRGACAGVVPRPHVAPAPTVPSAGPRPEVRGAYLPFLVL